MWGFPSPNPSNLPRLAVRCLLAAALAFLPSVASGSGRQPKKTDGPYKLTFGGSCAGRGRAVVLKLAVTVLGEVEDAKGRKGLLVAAMALDGDHCRGVGTVLGRPATFAGRLDGYAGDKHFRGARLLCSYTDSQGRSGRLAGPLD
jgi:hypothetical protein